MKKLSISIVFTASLLILMSTSLACAQNVSNNPPPDSRFKTDILVVVAHPDDESMIAGYLAKASFDEHKRISIVFCTRGNSGGNDVGYEQSDALADIRETEARNAVASIGIKHAWFLRAPDTPAPYGETHDVLRSLETWDHGKVLGELVRFIRLTRPEVVITMLPDVVVGENHQDHQASGVITTEAFDLAGNPTAFPEQVTPPVDRIWFGNRMEGLHPWQPEKLYYFTDASQRGFLKGNGPVYSMTAISPSKHESYAELATKEISFHRTQYGNQPAQRLASGHYGYHADPLGFVLGKSLVAGTATGDIFQNVVPGPIPYVPVRGYQPPENKPDFSIKLGGAWGFYKLFYPAHDLKSMEHLMDPQIGVLAGQNFPVPLVLHNNTDKSVTFHLNTQFPGKGWSIDSTADDYTNYHSVPSTSFVVRAHGRYPVRLRLVAPDLKSPEWQTVSWSAKADGKSAGEVSLKFFVGSH